MSRSLNQVTLIGNLGKDPEIRTTQDGNKIANLSLATSYTTKGGQEKTQWHRIVVFNPALIEITEKYLRKGSGLYVAGRIENRKFDDKNGQEKWVSEIIMNEMIMLGKTEAEKPETQMAAGQDFEDTPSTRAFGALDDDIPF
jgi:single-strand DNA-binding protein